MSAKNHRSILLKEILGRRHFIVVNIVQRHASPGGGDYERALVRNQEPVYEVCDNLLGRHRSFHLSQILGSDSFTTVPSVFALISNMPIVYIGRWEQKYENLTNKNSASGEIKIGRLELEQMDNDEAKRQELAKIKYRSMRGAARQEAIIEERRRKEEYSKQRQCLFPLTRAEVGVVKAPAAALEPLLSLKDKGKQRADPDGLEAIASGSTNRFSVLSRHQSPVSSTTTPPSPQLENDSISKPFPPRPRAKQGYTPMSTGKYRLRSIPPWFLVDQTCAAYATPVPDLRRVMELGVQHTASVMS